MLSQSMTAIFLSDVHLIEPTDLKMNLVIRFFEQTASQYEEIFIMGDFFDVWPVTTPYLIQRFSPILKTLKRLVDKGHRIHYFEGNHDFHLGQYFNQELGIRVYPNAHSVEWAGKKIYLAHGDLGNPKDVGYRALRYVLRRPLVKWAIEKVPAKIIYQLGERSSNASRKYQKRVGRDEEGIRRVYREAAQDIFRKGYDVVLMGHTHVPDDFTTQIEGRACRYLNTGDWVKHFSYVEFDGEQFYTKSHPVNAQ